ncbi:MAG: Rpn family recombination-promoting nuclease/putative transposase [Treponemataceae bacterium]|nr:Rpn family recombination-promoting nuclease/putative transposase [Treponemataceae bacterium]
MFEKVLQNREICQELLERLLKIKIDHIEYPEIEKTISPYYETKGVRLDVYVKDSDKVFDIELQNSAGVDIYLRTRYYQSMLDTDNLLKGEHYSKLPESFIIFICTYDPIGDNLPSYTYKTCCIENPKRIMKDKITKKFYNATAYKQEKDMEISAFLEYICNQKTVDDFTSKIDSFVQKIKKQEVNRKEYSSVNIHDQDIYFKAKNEGIAQGFQQGEYQAKIETAKNMLKDKLSLETIIKYTGLSESIILKLSAE